MNCLICKRPFYKKRSFLDLFKEEKGYICDLCYKRYPIKINVKLKKNYRD